MVKQIKDNPLVIKSEYFQDTTCWSEQNEEQTTLGLSDCITYVRGRKKGKLLQNHSLNSILCVFLCNVDQALWWSYVIVGDFLLNSTIMNNFKLLKIKLLRLVGWEINPVRIYCYNSCNYLTVRKKSIAVRCRLCIGCIWQSYIWL